MSSNGRRSPTALYRPIDYLTLRSFLVALLRCVLLSLPLLHLSTPSYIPLPPSIVSSCSSDQVLAHVPVRHRINLFSKCIHIGLTASEGHSGRANQGERKGQEGASERVKMATARGESAALVAYAEEELGRRCARSLRLCLGGEDVHRGDKRGGLSFRAGSWCTCLDDRQARSSADE
jgi:hypothetical protein